MNTSDILRRFAQMGNISIAEATKQANLADLSMAMIQSNLKEDLEEEPNEALLTSVCASIVNYWYQLSRSAAQPAGSFQADGITVSSDIISDISAAKTLRDEWWSVASKYLKDLDFAFFLMPPAEEESEKPDDEEETPKEAEEKDEN